MTTDDENPWQPVYCHNCGQIIEGTVRPLAAKATVILCPGCAPKVRSKP